MLNLMKIIKKINGFGLIDLLVAIAITAFLTIALIKNFSSTISYDRVANVVASDLRNAQSYAISSKKYQGPLDSTPVSRCGWGLHQDTSNSSTYIIYAGPSAAANCSSRGYQDTSNSPTFKTAALDSRLEFETSPRFKDIFYEPPDPKTYFNNSSNPPGAVEEIVIRKIGITKAQCNAGNVACIKICAYMSGRIEITKTGSCP